MAKLLNKSNIIIKNEEMPKDILCYYVQIYDTSYLLLNNHLNEEQELATYNALSYYYLTNKESGILTLEQFESNSHPYVLYFSEPSVKLSAIS